MLYRVEDEGAAPLVALVHGSMDRAATFARVGRELGDRATVRYDRRGYGRSVAFGPPTDVGGHVDDLLALLGGRQAVVLGHSFGGVVALAAAVRAPEQVVAVVAYEAPLTWRPWWPSGTAGEMAVQALDPEAAAEAFMRRMIGDQRWADLPARVRADRRAEGPALVAELGALRRAVPFRPSEVAVPVLVARGSRSAAHHRRGAEELAAEIPDASLHDVEGADHGAHLTHPAEVARLIGHAVGRTEFVA